MRCKPGDLAIVTKGPNYGRLCQVLAASIKQPGEWFCEALQGFYLGKRDGYRFTECRDYPAGTNFNCQDSMLRPLRGDPGEDETLRIAGYPACHNQPEHA